MRDRNVVISPAPSWWHAHRRGYVWMLCTKRWCDKPYDLAQVTSGG